MSEPSLLEEPSRVDEPLAAQEFSAVLTQVATGHRTVIVRRDGADLAAVVPLEHLELLREALARQEVEKRAAQIDWDRREQARRPPQSWFDDDDNPFEPEEEPAP
jgi:PHD/YefM family antitoxin component YafN of YafNO toxin-antitoxin module